MRNNVVAEEVQKSEMAEAVLSWPEDEGRCASDAIEEHQSDLVKIRTHRAEQDIAFAEGGDAAVDG